MNTAEITISHVLDDNDRLRDELRSLKQEQRRVSDLVRENKMLREQLKKLKEAIRYLNGIV